VHDSPMHGPTPEYRHTLTDAVERIAAAGSEDDLVEALRACARRTIGADGIAVVRREGPMVVYVAEDAVGPLWIGQRFVLRTCISGLSMLDGAPILIPDTRADPRVPQAAYIGTFVRSMAMVPIGAPEPQMALGAYWRSVGPIAPHALEKHMGLADAATRSLAKLAG